MGEPSTRHAANVADDPGLDLDDNAARLNRKPSGEESWRNLLALDADIFQQKNVRLLTPEARVLINLKLNGPMPVTEAMKLAGVSYRGFYAVIERLKQAGLVGQVKDKQDHRVRQLRLDPDMPIPPDNI